jgi:hypothetical protein
MRAPPLDEDVREQPLLLDFVEQVAPLHSLPDSEAFADEVFIALPCVRCTFALHVLDSVSLSQQTPESHLKGHEPGASPCYLASGRNSLVKAVPRRGHSPELGGHWKIRSAPVGPSR